MRQRRVLERRAVELGEQFLGAVEQARAMEVLRQFVGGDRRACRRAGRTRSSRFWCMRIARSISPCRRNSEPSAKCRSIVCGSTLTTSMNDSMALSGCSFSRKLRPRKYDSGSARDSRSRCLMSMRAAIQPSAEEDRRDRQQPPQLEVHAGADLVRLGSADHRPSCRRSPRPKPGPDAARCRAPAARGVTGDAIRGCAARGASR